MATINVLDAAGATVAVEKPLVPGRAAAASSRPIALSTEDKTALDLVNTNLLAPTPAGTNKIGGVTEADGDNVALGARADTAATSTGSFSLIAIAKVMVARLFPTAGTNLSGTATTTSGGFFLAANAARRPGDVQGQNLSGVSVGFNEFGGTAAIGTAGTYTVPPGGTFSITTNAQVNFIAASGTAAISITSLI